MGHFISFIGLIVSLAGLSYTAITTFPDIWSQSEAKQWLFHSAGWLFAFVFGCGNSIHISILKRKHSSIKELHNESKIKAMELSRENSTIVRTLEYLMDRVSPETAIKRQNKREGDLDD